MKKNHILKFVTLIFVFLLTFLLFESNALAKEYFNVCNNSGVVKLFQLIGYGLQFIKIVVPILLIIMSSISLGKAVISSDDKEIKNAIMLFAKRAIAGVIIFFIPTLITFVFEIVDKTKVSSKFNCLSTCIADPFNCVMPKDGGVFGSEE